jgi:site-specific recombinase XerD
MSRSIHAAQGESLPYNHHLHQFLTFFKHERGFADATIVNRERSLKPFLGWLVAEDVPLSTVSPVVITKYFSGIVAGRWKRTTVSFHVQSLRSFFRYPAVEVGARRRDKQRSLYRSPRSPSPCRPHCLPARLAPCAV